MSSSKEPHFYTRSNFLETHRGGYVSNPAFEHETPAPGSIRRSPYSPSIRGAGIYHSVDEIREIKFNQRSTSKRKLLIPIAAISILVVIVTVAVVLGVVLSKGDDDDKVSSETLEITFQGEGTLTGKTWTPDYLDENSALYRSEQRQFIEEMDAQFLKSGLKDSYQSTVVTGFREGSVVVKFLIRMASRAGQTTTVNKNSIMNVMIFIQGVTSVNLRASGKETTQTTQTTKATTTATPTTKAATTTTQTTKAATTTTPTTKAATITTPTTKAATTSTPTTKAPSTTTPTTKAATTTTPTTKAATTTTPTTKGVTTTTPTTKAATTTTPKTKAATTTTPTTKGVTTTTPTTKAATTTTPTTKAATTSTPTTKAPTTTTPTIKAPTTTTPTTKAATTKTPTTKAATTTSTTTSTTYFKTTTTTTTVAQTETTTANKAPTVTPSTEINTTTQTPTTPTSSTEAQNTKTSKATTTSTSTSTTSTVAPTTASIIPECETGYTGYFVLFDYMKPYTLQYLDIRATVSIQLKTELENWGENLLKSFGVDDEISVFSVTDFGPPKTNSSFTLVTVAVCVESTVDFNNIANLLGIYMGNLPNFINVGLSDIFDVIFQYSYSHNDNMQTVTSPEFANVASILQAKGSTIISSNNLQDTIFTFYVTKLRLWKTMWEKEKMLVTTLSEDAPAPTPDKTDVTVRIGTRQDSVNADGLRNYLTFGLLFDSELSVISVDQVV